MEAFLRPRPLLIDCFTCTLQQVQICRSGRHLIGIVKSIYVHEGFHVYDDICVNCSKVTAVIVQEALFGHMVQ